MKKIIVVFCVLLSLQGNAQMQGIGVRLGAPVGITYKKFIQKRYAVEFVLGGASPYWNRIYYENSFEDYSSYDDYRYVSHYVESTIFFQTRYLSHFDIRIHEMEGKLNWYWGVGGMLKVAKVRYRYSDPLAIPSARTDVKSDLDIGPEAILGLEYTLEDIPLSVFGEASVMVEILDRPGAAKIFAAVGARYIFR